MHLPAASTSGDPCAGIDKPVTVCRKLWQSIGNDLSEHHRVQNHRLSRMVIRSDLAIASAECATKNPPDRRKRGGLQTTPDVSSAGGCVSSAVVLNRLSYFNGGKAGTSQLTGSTGVVGAGTSTGAGSGAGTGAGGFVGAAAGGAVLSGAKNSRGCACGCGCGASPGAEKWAGGTGCGCICTWGCGCGCEYGCGYGCDMTGGCPGCIGPLGAVQSGEAGGIMLETGPDPQSQPGLKTSAGA